jgi:hypothetical protein
MITQKDMMCAYPHKVPFHEEEDYLHFKFNSLESYISIPTNLNGHPKRFKESESVLNPTMVSPPLLPSQYSNEKSVVGKVGQLGRYFKKKGAIGKTAVGNAESLCVPLQSRPESCKPSLNRKNLRRLLKPKHFSGISIKDTVTGMGNLEVEKINVDGINLPERFITGESVDAIENTNLLLDDHSSSDTTFHKDIVPLFEIEINQAKLALENSDDADLVASLEVMNADSYQTPNIAGLSEMEDLSPGYTYEGAISESQKGLIEWEEEENDVEKSVEIEPLVKDISSANSSSVPILPNEFLESSQSKIEHESDQVMLESAKESKASKISGLSKSVSLLHLLSVRVGCYENKQKELSQEAITAAAEWGMGFAITDPFNVRGGGIVDAEAVYQSSDSFKSKKKFSGLGLSSLEGEGEGEEDGVDDVTVSPEGGGSSTSLQSEPVQKVAAKVSPKPIPKESQKQSETKKTSDKIDSSNPSTLVSRVDAPSSAPSIIDATVNDNGDQTGTKVEVSASKSVAFIQDLSNEMLNVDVISSVGETSNAESSDSLLVDSKEYDETTSSPVSSACREEEQLVGENNAGDKIQVHGQDFMSISHTPQPPPQPRSSPNKRIAATNIIPPMVVSDISPFPFFPMNFDNKIQQQKSVQNVKTISGVEHVIFGASKDTSDISATSSQSTSSSFTHREEVLRSSSTMVARRAYKEHFRMQKIEERSIQDRKLAGLMGWANTVHVICTDKQEQQQEQKRQEDEKVYNDRYNQPRKCGRSTNQESDIVELDTNMAESHEFSDNYAFPQSSNNAKGGGRVNNSSVGVGQLLGGSLADVDIGVGNAMYSDSLTVYIYVYIYLYVFM